MADYNKTPQVVAQVAELRKLMSDGRTMTPQDIMTALNRKWISSVVYYLGEEVNLETVKDGRRVIGYRLGSGAAKTVQSKVSETVETAQAASKRSVKTKTVEPPVSAIVQAMSEGSEIDMHAIVTVAGDYKEQPKAVMKPTVPDIAPRDPNVPLHKWEDKDLEDVNGVNLVMPEHLRRT